MRTLRILSIIVLSVLSGISLYSCSIEFAEETPADDIQPPKVEELLRSSTICDLTSRWDS